MLFLSVSLQSSDKPLLGQDVSTKTFLELLYSVCVSFISRPPVSHLQVISPPRTINYRASCGPSRFSSRSLPRCFAALQKEESTFFFLRKVTWTWQPAKPAKTCARRRLNAAVPERRISMRLCGPWEKLMVRSENRKKERNNGNKQRSERKAGRGSNAESRKQKTAQASMENTCLTR